MNPAMQANYRGHPPQRSPAAARRGPGPPPHAQPLPNQHFMAQQRNAALESEMAKRRARKPTDLEVPDGIEDLVIGEGVQQYKSLRASEKKLDATMIRKRLEIQDSINRNVKYFRTLRIYITNTAENQPWQVKGLDENAFDFNTGVDASYKIRIVGDLLDDEDDDKKSDASGRDGDEDDDDEEMDGAETDFAKKPLTKLSDYFKSIKIEYERFNPMRPDEFPPIEWKKPQAPPNAPAPPPGAEFRDLYISRKSDENLNVTISAVLDENPERFQLSKEMTELLDVETATRADVVMGIWDYVRYNGLQEDEEKRMVRCDDTLKSIFKQDTVFFPQVPELVSSHVFPLKPLQMRYTIRVDPAFQADPQYTIYDIRVPVPDPVRAKMFGYLHNQVHIQQLRDITQTNDQIALLVQELHHRLARHRFFTALSTDPVNFLKRWLSSQKRDLEVILGEATRGGGEDGSGPEFQRGGPESMWNSEIVREQVRYMLAKQETVGAR